MLSLWYVMFFICSTNLACLLRIEFTSLMGRQNNSAFGASIGLPNSQREGWRFAGSRKYILSPKVNPSLRPVFEDKPGFSLALERHTPYWHYLIVT